MSNREVIVSGEQLRDAQQALDIAALNGIVSLAIVLKKRGLITDGEVVGLHESVTKPLNIADVANNPLVQDAQHNLDQLFAVLLEPR